LTHDDDELRLHDVDLAGEPPVRLLLVRPGELEAVRPVDRGRIDMEPLQRLQHCLTRAAEEGHALVLLGVLWAVLEEQDVREGVSGAEHRGSLRSGRLRDLTAEIVDLGDRFLQVPL
jgi:hypothetical protein